MRMDAKHLLAAVLALAAFLVVAGCGDDDEDDGAETEVAPVGVFVGTVEGIDAYIGIKSDGGAVGGYVCNGRGRLPAREVVSVWLDESSLEGGEAALTDRRGAQVGEVSLSEGGASGEIMIDGETHAFDAERATGEAGIYREAAGDEDPEAWLKGWVVLADGSVRGARHTGGVNIKDGTSNTFKPLSSSPPSAGFIDPTTDL